MDVAYPWASGGGKDSKGLQMLVTVTNAYAVVAESLVFPQTMGWV